jgi:hypothetical protein
MDLTYFLYPQVYLDFIDESFAKIQAMRLVADAQGKKFSKS